MLVRLGVLSLPVGVIYQSQYIDYLPATSEATYYIYICR